MQTFSVFQTKSKNVTYLQCAYSVTLEYSVGLCELIIMQYQFLLFSKFAFGYFFRLFFVNLNQRFFRFSKIKTIFI